ncbi:MAG TPA: NAD-dependent epimerase/dehydratase family protein [Gemmatimonadales bacterium]|nr:NAD-dependent epimerase/dehydratase family protein [Gemmatimonadales bacterium]
MSRAAPGPVLITGGAGFIGTNLSHRLLAMGQPVIVYDNLSRAGVERNLCWLQVTHPGLVDAWVADVRDAESLGAAVAKASAVFHFAAQVAVTTSLDGPIHDFEVNARGTLNLLEAIRRESTRPGRTPPPLVFTSTNKVYGALDDVALEPGVRRYRPADPELGTHGVSEARPLDFHSPYGCSKGAADQYVLDYAHTFGLPALVFRMSCIYGPHQFGTEDQGWLAHFLIRALAREPITLYGDGRQVRDVLFVEDLVDAFLAARARVDRLAGTAFNIGGGPENTVSLLELIEMIGELTGRTPEAHFEPWRPADQRYYVSDTRRFGEAADWAPRVDVSEGLERLHAWLKDERIAGRGALAGGEGNGARAAADQPAGARANGSRPRPAGAGRQQEAAEWRQP